MQISNFFIKSQGLPRRAMMCSVDTASLTETAVKHKPLSTSQSLDQVSVLVADEIRDADMVYHL